MQGSDLIFIVLPVVIPLVLAIGVALPFIADSRAEQTQLARDAVRHRAKARAGSAVLHIPAAQVDTAPPAKPCCVIPMTSLRVIDGSGGEPGGPGGMRLWRVMAGSIAVPDRLRDRILHDHFDLVLTAPVRSRPDIVTTRVPVLLHVHDGRPATSHRGSVLNRAGRRP